MKNTGMTRKVDDLGRVVIPAEMRRAFNIQEGDHLDISVEENSIILSKREEACVFCRSVEDLKEYRGRMVCASCVQELSGAAPETATQAAPGSWEPFSET